MGCDISEERCGIRHVGRDKFLSALDSFEDKDPSALNEESFAEALAKKTTIYNRLCGAKKKIRNELTRVRHWFTERGKYYDSDGNILTIDGVLAEQADRATLEHMEGMLDPKSCAPFTPEQRRDLDSLRTHNLAHKSYVDDKSINGLSLPEGKTSVEECTVAELKAIIIPRGGSVTGRDGNALNKQELQRTVKAFLFGEEENSHTVYFDRSKTSNGIFAKIDTSQKKAVPEIINNLLRCSDYEKGRPTPKPPTTEFCSWIPGSKCKREVTTLLPASRTAIMQLPGSNEEAKRRLENGHNMTRHVGETARYDWHGGDEMKLAELNEPEYISKERVMPLFLHLQEILQESCSDDE